MYDYFIGFITDKRKSSKGNFITIETNGTGYLLEVTERDFSQFCLNNNESRKVFSSLIHREDTMALYGFLTKESRDIFQILLSVSGVGSKMALSLLDEFDVFDLISLVIDGNFKELTRAKGVGPKLAQKIILELKDKLVKTEHTPKSEKLPQNQAVEDAQAVMLSLGYSSKEVEEALLKAVSSLDNPADTEEMLRKALVTLSI